ncbi:MAG TPA: hypothetical protein VKD90_03850 [Gemmataceae bacterium]|nr:hypothetical protein [Gemmataceae bacterium]
MSRTALVGTFVFVVAGLSGCASPARVIDSGNSRVVVAIPDNTNTWPFYYRDEAQRAALDYIHDPVLVTSSRVKVGEQLTNTQDTTRRDLGKDKKFGEVVTSTNSSSVADKYEYHLEFRSRGPVTVTTSDPLNGPAKAPTVNGWTPVTPAGGTAPAGTPEAGRSQPAPVLQPPGAASVTGPR